MSSKKWGKEDDAKLKELFRRGVRNGGVSTTDLGTKAVKEVNDKYFPNRDYKNFGPLFRKKARAWNLNSTLQGSRKYLLLPLLRLVLTMMLINMCSFSTGRDAAKKSEAKTAKEVNEAEESEEEEDEDFTADTAEETPAPSFEEYHPPSVNELAELIGTMSVNNPSSSGATNLSVQFPFISYQYVEDGRKMVSYDFLVIGASKDQYRPKVTGNGGELHVGMVLPRFFVDPNRLLLANSHVGGFNANTNKSTALEEVGAKVTNGLQENDLLFANPMTVKLPFKCEEDIVEWEIQAFHNEDEVWTLEAGSQQYFFVLSVGLRHVEKIRKNTKKGGFRIIGSPSKAAAAKNNNGGTAKRKGNNGPDQNGQVPMDDDEDDNN